jgi:hypothetical protein
MAGTLAEKIWADHVVRSAEGEPDILYIDLHLIHEVTSPQAFDGLRLAGRPVRRPELTLATEDHNVPTTPGPITDPVSLTQVETLRANCVVRAASTSVIAILPDLPMALPRRTASSSPPAPPPTITTRCAVCLLLPVKEISLKPVCCKRRCPM